MAKVLSVSVTHQLAQHIMFIVFNVCPCYTGYFMRHLNLPERKLIRMSHTLPGNVLFPISRLKSILLLTKETIDSHMYCFDYWFYHFCSVTILRCLLYCDILQTIKPNGSGRLETWSSPLFPDNAYQVGTIEVVPNFPGFICYMNLPVLNYSFWLFPTACLSETMYFEKSSKSWCRSNPLYFYLCPLQNFKHYFYLRKQRFDF